jgi:atypical dual specificity phosphatase
MLHRIWLGIRAGSFTWIVPDHVGAARFPRSEAALRALAERQVTLLVNLHERPVPEARLAAHGLRAVHLPVRDLTPPSVAQLQAGVAAMAEALLAGERVTVHCGAGLGRTGTLLAAWLVSRGRSADAAIAEVRARRPGSVETEAQVEAVRAFAQAWAGHDAGAPATAPSPALDAITPEPSHPLDPGGTS